MRELSMAQNAELYTAAHDMIAELEILGGAKYAESIIQDERFSVCEYSSGEIIFSKNSYKKALSLLVCGKATARKTNVGGEVVIRTFSQGDLFGVAALFSDEDEYVSEIRADGKCVIAFVPQDMISEIFCRFPDAAIAYISLLSRKIRYLNTKLDSFSAPNAHAKLCHFLLENPNVNSSMQALSERLGMSRMTLYRNLDLLVQNGCISKKGKVIKVIDCEALSRAASSEEIF